jgi:uncharacterized small protein (DUF1192 family)
MEELLQKIKFLEEENEKLKSELEKKSCKRIGISL